MFLRRLMPSKLRRQPRSGQSRQQGTGHDRTAPATDQGSSTRRHSSGRQSTPAATIADIDVAAQVAASTRETEVLVQKEAAGASSASAAHRPGAPINRRSAFYQGFVATIGVLIAYGLVQAVLRLTNVIAYIVVALFFSLGLEPIVAALTRRGWRRGWSVLLALAGVAVLWALIGFLVVPPVVSQANELVQQAPGYLTDLQHSKLVHDLNQRWHVTSQLQQELRRHLLSQSTAGQLVGGILGAGEAIATGIVGTFVVLVLTVYFLAAMPKLKTAVYQLFPHSRRPRMVYLSEEISRRVGGYVLGQLCVAAVNGIFSYIILALLGLPFAVVLAVVVALLALVPIVGTLIGGALVTLVALTAGWQQALIVLGYYVVYHMFESYVLAPRIMHRFVHVPAVVTIVAILAGGTLFGIIGALVAIPVAAGLRLIYTEVLVSRQQSA